MRSGRWVSGSVVGGSVIGGFNKTQKQDIEFRTNKIFYF